MDCTGRRGRCGYSCCEGGCRVSSAHVGWCPYHREVCPEGGSDSAVTPFTHPLQAFKHRMGLAPEASARRSHFGGLSNMSGLAQRLKSSVEKAAHQASTSMHHQPKASKARASGDASHPPLPGNATALPGRTLTPTFSEQAGGSRDAAAAGTQQGGGGRGRLQGLMGELSRSARQAKSAAAESLDRARQQRQGGSSNAQT